MNPGLAIFKKHQRLQGGTARVQEQEEFTPKDLAEMYAAIQKQNEQRRAESHERGVWLRGHVPT